MPCSLQKGLLCVRVPGTKHSKPACRLVTSLESVRLVADREEEGMVQILEVAGHQVVSVTHVDKRDTFRGNVLREAGVDMEVPEGVMVELALVGMAVAMMRMVGEIMSMTTQLQDMVGKQEERMGLDMMIGAPVVMGTQPIAEEAIPQAGRSTIADPTGSFVLLGDLAFKFLWPEGCTVTTNACRTTLRHTCCRREKFSSRTSPLTSFISFAVVISFESFREQRII